MILIFLFIFFAIPVLAQPGPDYWQQHVSYQMEIDFDVKTHRFNGNQTILYTNHSPDTLKTLYYHLFYNAFQPGSMMDVRSRTIDDPDSRIKDRILELAPDEIGYHKIEQLKVNGRSVTFQINGTIMKVDISNYPILPNQRAKLEMVFNSQVPVQIRRTGRENREGIAYTMTQWYPKLSEYDEEGWHPNPYIGREFFGVFGEFDVRITLDSSYVIGGTGVLQNPDQIGHGYEPKGSKVNRPDSDRLTWHFKAENVHDFAWAADPDYTHWRRTTQDGIELHFFFQNDSLTNWKSFPEYMERMFDIMNRQFGHYPYQQFSFIQGGDGGMEYPMCTMIVGQIRPRGLVSVGTHEAIHNWYYGVLGTNESKYPWMDEGFTTYTQNEVMAQLYNVEPDRMHQDEFESYKWMTNSGKAEPMITHADHYMTNRAYGINAYSKGALFLHQLEYIIGQSNFEKGMKRYFNSWKFKHPKPDDFIRVMERVSGIELDWYLDYWTNTVNTIDYGLKSVECDGKSTHITLTNYSNLPMPLDIEVVLADSTIHLYNIPLRMMNGAKAIEFTNVRNYQLDPWPWTYPEYKFQIPYTAEEILSVEIDPSGRMADLDRNNNRFPLPETIQFINKNMIEKKN